MQKIKVSTENQVDLSGKNYAKRVHSSAHMKNDNLHRVAYIGTHMGFGDVVDEFHVVNDKVHGEHYEYITTTGIFIAKAMDRETIITMYIATLRQLKRLYGNKKSIPIQLINVVRRNDRNGEQAKSEAWKE